MLDVPDVQFELLRPVERVAPIHLRPTGHARADQVATRLPGRVSRQIAEEQRAWAHKAQVAGQHVPELRQLIETRLAQDAA